MQPAHTDYYASKWAVRVRLDIRGMQYTPRRTSPYSPTEKNLTQGCVHAKKGFRSIRIIISAKERGILNSYPSLMVDLRSLSECGRPWSIEKVKLYFIAYPCFQVLWRTPKKRIGDSSTMITKSLAYEQKVIKNQAFLYQLHENSTHSGKKKKKKIPHLLITKMKSYLFNEGIFPNWVWAFLLFFFMVGAWTVGKVALSRSFLKLQGCDRTHMP